MLGDEPLGLGRERVEVVAERSGEVRRGERLASGDSSGHPLGERPVERVGRTGRRRGERRLRGDGDEDVLAAVVIVAFTTRLGPATSVAAPCR